MSSIRLEAPDPREPVVVVSCDSHVGPLLQQQLRDYCPREYLDDFDAFVKNYGERRYIEGSHMASRENIEARARDAQSQSAKLAEMMASMAVHPNLSRPGHHDPVARLADMDVDGVAAEVMYHFSQNGEVLPWVGHGLDSFDARLFEYAKVSYQIYNRWLADFCSTDPKRLLGLAYIPAWDIEASAQTVRSAAKAGLAGINFPACNRPGVRGYNHVEWDPFWAACSETGIALHTHGNGGPMFDYWSGTGGGDIGVFEVGGYMSKRATWHLIYGQVFDRFPELKLLLTELSEHWYQSTQWELDSTYKRAGSVALRKERPSAYFATNIFQGASFLSPEQAEEAHRFGYSANVLWGRDYPHVEGCFYAPDGAGETVGRLSLRHALSRVPMREAVLMAGQNGIRLLNLDADYLAKVAVQVGAPTAEQLVQPVETFPAVGRMCNAFTGMGGARSPERDEALLATRVPAT